MRKKESLIISNSQKLLWLQEKEYKFQVINKTEDSIELDLGEDTILRMSRSFPIYLRTGEICDLDLFIGDKSYRVLDVKQKDENLHLIIK